jgi:hypothetical protein
MYQVFKCTRSDPSELLMYQSSGECFLLCWLEWSHRLRNPLRVLCDVRAIIARPYLSTVSVWLPLKWTFDAWPVLCCSCLTKIELYSLEETLSSTALIWFSTTFSVFFTPMGLFLVQQMFCVNKYSNPSPTADLKYPRFFCLCLFLPTLIFSVMYPRFLVCESTIRIVGAAVAQAV